MANGPDIYSATTVYFINYSYVKHDVPTRSLLMSAVHLQCTVLLTYIQVVFCPY